MTTEGVIRTRTRAPQPTPQGQQLQRQSLLRTGAAAETMRAEEANRQAERRNRVYAPFRFFLPWNKPTEQERTGEFIILDSDIDACPVFYEHAMPDPSNGGKFTDNCVCIKELEHCPACERSERDSYYVQVISIIDLRGYHKRDGVTWVPYSKRLLPVKFQQQGFFRQLCKETFQGNMRGAHIISTREHSQQSPAIGAPRLAINNQTQTVLRYSEDQLVQAFQHPEVRSTDGTKVIKQANADLYPYDYASLFATPTAEELRQKYGGVVPAGSTAETAAAWNQGQPPAPGAGIAPAAPAAPPAGYVPAPAAAPAPMPVAAAPVPAPAPPPAAIPAPAPAAPLPAPVPIAAPTPAAAPVAAPPPPGPAGITPQVSHAAPPTGFGGGRPHPDDEIPF